jgi:hypothetical protein
VCTSSFVVCDFASCDVLSSVSRVGKEGEGSKRPKSEEEREREGEGVYALCCQACAVFRVVRLRRRFGGS